jgi:hypothetical protein
MTSIMYGLGGLFLFFMAIGIVNLLWRGESKISGKSKDGRTMNVKMADLPHWKSGPGYGEWKPNGWLPGVGTVPGHSVEEATKAWTSGCATMAVVVAVVVVGYVILR